MSFNARYIAVLGAVSILCGCTSGSLALFDTARSLAFLRSGAASGKGLNPDYEYLRLVIDGRVVFLARGYIDPDPAGPIDVWYSAEKEVLRFQHGRLVGATGLTTEWRRVAQHGAPSWKMIAQAPQRVAWERTRDVMPGYRIGVADTISATAIAAPSRTNLVGLDPRALAWFEERVESRSEPLPASRYAVDLRGAADTVVYSEQCLSPRLCFSWQRWIAVPDTPSK